MSSLPMSDISIPWSVILGMAPIFDAVLVGPGKIALALTVLIGLAGLVIGGALATPARGDAAGIEVQALLRGGVANWQLVARVRLRSALAGGGFTV